MSKSDAMAAAAESWPDAYRPPVSAAPAAVPIPDVPYVEESSPVESDPEPLPVVNNPAFAYAGETPLEEFNRAREMGREKFAYFNRAAQNRLAFEDAELSLCPAAIRAGRRSWAGRRNVTIGK